MKRTWKVRRTFLAQRDGLHRWDQAFQRLLQWATTEELRTKMPIIPQEHPSQEEKDENRSLSRSKIDR